MITEAQKQTLFRNVPEGQILEWNEKYNLSIPLNIRFYDVLKMIFDGNIPRQTNKE